MLAGREPTPELLDIVRTVTAAHRWTTPEQPKGDGGSPGLGRVSMGRTLSCEMTRGTPILEWAVICGLYLAKVLDTLSM